MWEQQAALAGKITLLDDVRETLGATLKALGYSYNTTNPDHIAAAFERLKSLKPAIAAFQSFGWENQLIAGDLDLCMTYSTWVMPCRWNIPSYATLSPPLGVPSGRIRW